MHLHTILVLMLAGCALLLVARLLRLYEFLTRPRGAWSAADAAGDLAWALIFGGGTVLAGWLLVAWE